jgi:L-2-hydroxyglutarate oxidase LhgO
MRADGDICIIGAGIVGLATALALSERFPGRTICVVEKEPRVGAHQTGHNSGVVHAGIYYKPGSFKARLCVEGARLLREFCEARGVRYESCGKVIVATNDAEVPRLLALHDRGVANGAEGLKLVGAGQLREIEPHARAVRALLSPKTAIVDYAEVARAMAAEIERRGVDVTTGAKVLGIARVNGRLVIETSRGTVLALGLINCAGLHADMVARLMGIRVDVRIVPFRGEYYELRPDSPLVRGLIYPVPDPAFPFLGVHFTRRIGGGIEAGPNAVLAFAREGYRRRDVNPREVLAALGWAGCWSLGRKQWRMGLHEMYRSFSKRAFVRALRKLVPEIGERDLVPGGAGVRAQAVARNGALVDDFSIVEAPGAIHVLNAPSPAATASIAIGRHIASLAEASFGLAAPRRAG